MIVSSRSLFCMALVAAGAFVMGDWFLYGQDGSLPKFYFRVSGSQLDIGVDSPVTVHMRAQDGKAVKTIEAKPDGSSQTTTFSRDGKRMYLMQDSFDGTSNVTIFDNDKEKFTLKLNKDGIVEVKIPALPKEIKTESTSKTSPVDDKPEVKTSDTSSILKNK